MTSGCREGGTVRSVLEELGVPGVMASGYYVASKILEKDRIDLESRMKSCLEKTQNGRGLEGGKE